jgi:hypothetical protein
VPTMRELRRAAWERQGGLCAATGLSLGDPGRRAAGTCTTGSPGAWAGQPGTGTGCATWSRSSSAAHNMGSPRLAVDGVRGRSIHTDPAWARPPGLLLSQHGGTTRRRSRCGSSRARLGFLHDDGGWTVVA